MFRQRTTATLTMQAKSRAESSGRLNAKQRLDSREDQWTLARLSQKPGKSRRMMFEERKIESIIHEERIDAANKARVFKENPTWSKKGDSHPFWKAKRGYVPQPKIDSCQQLWTETTSKPFEKYNKYSDPAPDPFKAEYHKKIKYCAEDSPTNVAKIAPHPQEALVAQLRANNLVKKETNFTDYQLYFKDGIRDAAKGVEDPTEDDPLYSSFTRSKEFDPNTGLISFNPVLR